MLVSLRASHHINKSIGLRFSNTYYGDCGETMPLASFLLIHLNMTSIDRLEIFDTVEVLIYYNCQLCISFFTNHGRIGNLDTLEH